MFQGDVSRGMAKIIGNPQKNSNSNSKQVEIDTNKLHPQFLIPLLWYVGMILEDGRKVTSQTMVLCSPVHKWVGNIERVSEMTLPREEGNNTFNQPCKFLCNITLQ